MWVRYKQTSFTLCTVINTIDSELYSLLAKKKKQMNNNTSAKLKLAQAITIAKYIFFY